jgi:hypothetical protein
MQRIVSSILMALTLGGCYVHEPDRRGERREERREAECRDREGRPCRHHRWRDEDVYFRDGRWYSRRGNDWVVRPEVDIHIE